jgi:hypothetical protein
MIQRTPRREKTQTDERPGSQPVHCRLAPSAAWRYGALSNVTGFALHALSAVRFYPGLAWRATIALAVRKPSTAALTMPPAYPAPSPHG